MSKTDHRQLYRPRPPSRLPAWIWRLWGWC